MNKKLRWGILGTARIARNSLIPAIIESTNGEVRVIASRDLNKAEACAEQFNIPVALGSYKSLLDHPDIDAVYTPLPASMHAEWSIRAAEAGKHVLCEKPLAANADEVREMIRVFKEKRLLLAEALMYKYHPLTRRMIELIQSGAIGKLKTVCAQFNADQEEGDIRWFREMAGGGLLDVGSYCISAMRLMTGEEPSHMSALAVYNDSGVDINMAGTLLFPSGVTGHFGCSLEAEFDCSYGASGTEGRLLIDFGALCPWPGSAFTIRHWRDGNCSEYVIPPANHYLMLVEDFGRAVLEGTPMKMSLDDALNNMLVLDRLAAIARINGAD